MWAWMMLLARRQVPEIAYEEGGISLPHGSRHYTSACFSMFQHYQTTALLETQHDASL